jgi:hypothetical protein
LRCFDLEAEEVEEAKEVEEEGSRKRHRERKALRAAGYVGAERACVATG